MAQNVRLLLEQRCQALADGNEKQAGEYVHALARAKMHMDSFTTREWSISGLSKAVTARIPFGPGLSPEVATEVDRLEVWGTMFEHDGDDFCMFVAMRKDGSSVTIRKVAGH